MVASVNKDLYTPFPKPFIPDEGFHSSEDGSDLHSPVFEQQPYPQPHSHMIPDHADSLHQSASDLHINSPSYDSLYYMSDTPSSAGQALDFYDPLSNSAVSANHAQAAVNPQSFPSSSYNFPSSIRYSSLVDTATAHDRSNTYLNPPVSVPSLPPMAPSPTSPTRATTLPEEDSSETSPTSPTRVSAARSGRGSRKEISNVVIACRQCRARKIRCDSTRPECNNCHRRNNECVYDAAPKRRGPDKRPGTRQRSCKKRSSDESVQQPKKKRRTEPADPSGPAKPARPSQLKTEPDLSTSGLHHLSTTALSPHPLSPSPVSPSSYPLSPSPVSPSSYRSGNGHGFVLPTKRPQPPTFHRDTPSAMKVDSLDTTFTPTFDPHLSSPASLGDGNAASIPAEYNPHTWWDNLLDSYPLSREQALETITTDLNTLFRSSNYWLTFINVSSFIQELYDPQARAHMQPSLVLGALALATLLKSSELEMGAAGRGRALQLRDAAHGSLKASWNSQWIDLGLAEAAMMLAMFETSAHPQYTPARADAALGTLDKIIQTLQLTSLDINDPHALDFSNGVPTIARAPGFTLPKKCDCVHYTDPSQSGSMSYLPVWDQSWSTAECRNEETRRLCWSALMLVANHTVACAAVQRAPMNLFLGDSSNFHLMFPDEYHERSIYVGPHAGKDTVWALYCRSMLIWNCCTRFQDERLESDAKAQLGVAVFVETREVEQALDAHSCNIDTALTYMCREFISNIRLAVTHLMRRMLLDPDVGSRPYVNRRLAEDWLSSQEQVARRVSSSIHRVGEANVHLFLRRPFQTQWFVTQMETCLRMWAGEPSLIRALELAKSFLVAIDVLNALWPSVEFRRRGAALREKLHQSCVSAGVPPPLLPEFTLPSALLARI
ncbi:hypothetical protein OF83DRAFT_1170514 [Amylostereum chailletii]|nr:hypothetical protein OF83DRAFT_1170514 [Amylostereum chailletii]